MRLKAPEKHQRILDAAVKVFASKGFFQAKVSEIAREAQVADGTVYLYFKSKDDLLISIFEVKMRKAIARFREAALQEEGALPRLRRLIRMHLGELQSDPHLAAVFQVELRQSQRFMREYAKSELKEYLDLIGEIIQEGQNEGTLRSDIPVGLAKRLIFGTIDEVVSTWVMSGMKQDMDSLVSPLLDLFLNGIGKGDAASRLEVGEALDGHTARRTGNEAPGG
ncbi:MAG: TetR family transcriptional regulator [Syntrophobacteraceae bacterium]|jgi:TetR/AcrR family fatty acid metabolism transcriptional regulator|nr:TetR family transcriptional regulator [Syntrophobacteraceae bacterium]